VSRQLNARHASGPAASGRRGDVLADGPLKRFDKDDIEHAVANLRRRIRSASGDATLGKRATNK
jgi:hypothetical protein